MGNLLINILVEISIGVIHKMWLRHQLENLHFNLSQAAFAYSKLTIETLEKSVKYVQS